MGNRTYGLPLHCKRAPAAGRICAGRDSAGWNEPLRVGFWRGCCHECEDNHTAKEEKLVLLSGVTRRTFRKWRIRGPLKCSEEGRKESIDRARFRRSICQGISQESQHVRNAEGFLETTRPVVASTSRCAFEQIAGHVDQQRFLCSGSFEDALGGLAAVHGVAAGRKVQVAEKHVIAGAPEVRESFLRGRGTVHS